METQRLFNSALAVHGVDWERIRAANDTFKEMAQGKLRPKLNAVLFQSSVLDVLGLRLDAVRLRHWNRGMAALMKLVGQKQHIGAGG